MFNDQSSFFVVPPLMCDAVQRRWISLRLLLLCGLNIFFCAENHHPRAKIIVLGRSPKFVSGWHNDPFTGRGQAGGDSYQFGNTCTKEWLRYGTDGEKFSDKCRLAGVYYT
jgi:hypothetical protein